MDIELGNATTFAGAVLGYAAPRVSGEGGKGAEGGLEPIPPAENDNGLILALPGGVFLGEPP